MKDAMLYETRDEGKVRCHLCSHRCVIGEGKRGICGVRENRDGKLYTLVYGKVVAKHIDPIEKKPLFNFLPGSKAFSIGTVGCNFRCKHCQNSDISQYPQTHDGKIIGEDITPEQVVQSAKATGCQSIAYTYNEPTVFFEMAYDTAVIAHREGIRNVFVSNGYMSAEAARELAPHLDAINVDVKAFTDKFYKEVCGARLKPVLETIELMKKLSVWVEVTTLIIPGWNDTAKELREIAQFVKNVGEEVPWHVTAFYPSYLMMDHPPTPPATLRLAREIGISEGLRYVYEGNVPSEKGENTYCYGCGAVVVERSGLWFVRNLVRNGKCPVCGKPIDGVGM